MTRTASFEAIGTRWLIEIHDTIDESGWQILEAAIHSRITDFDATYSRFRSDSLVSRMAQTAGEYAMPKDGLPLFDFYGRLYETTGGLVTPLIGNTLSDAGYDANYSLRQKEELHQPPKWSDVIEYGTEALTIKQPAILDFGAAGKGYLVDLVSQLITSIGAKDFIINAGGDILHRTAHDRPVTIGLENPRDTSEAIGVITLNHASLCASAGSRRSWGKYTHILNPTTLESPTDIIATWVVADSTLHADGLATALFFVAPSALGEFSFDYAILRQDMSLEYSNTMPLTPFGE